MNLAQLAMLGNGGGMMGRPRFGGGRPGMMDRGMGMPRPMMGQEAPGNGQMPGNGQVPGGVPGEVPGNGQIPGNGEMPTSPGEMPGTGEIPGNGQVPVGAPGELGGAIKPKPAMMGNPMGMGQQGGMESLLGQLSGMAKPAMEGARGAMSGNMMRPGRDNGQMGGGIEQILQMLRGGRG